MVVLAIVTTGIPLSTMTFARQTYIKRRLTFLGVFRLFRIVTILVNNFLAPDVLLGTPGIPFFTRALISNSALLHGMHAVGAQISFEVHILLQMLAIAAVWTSNYLCCLKAGNEVLTECATWNAAIIAGILQFLIVVALPSVVVYKIENLQRASFIGASTVQKKYQ